MNTNTEQKIKFVANSANFTKIPGAPIAYWVGDHFYSVYEKGTALKVKGDTRQGMATSDNNRFLRLWYEVDFNKIGIGCKTSFDALEAGRKWYPYNKGGEYRKWYGNIGYVVNYENDGRELKAYATDLYRSASRTIKSMSEYFRECISWSKVSGGDIAFRYYPSGFIFDVAGCCIFYEERDRMLYDLGMINSIVATHILRVVSPTLNYEAGQIASLPIIYKANLQPTILSIIRSNVDTSGKDWDAFETSWDFKKHPLL